MAGRTRTLAELVSDVRRVVDADGQHPVDGRHPRDLVVRCINQACQRLTHLLVESGDRYWIRTGAGVTQANVESVALGDYDGSPYASPTRILDVIASQAPGGTSDNKYWRLRRMTGNEYNRYRSIDHTGPPERWLPVRSEGEGWVLVVSPLPDKVYAIRFEYTPSWVDLDNDGDEFDGIGGYEDYVVYDAAVRISERDANHDGRLPILLAARDRAEADVRRFSAMTGEVSAVTMWPEPRIGGGAWRP